MDTQFLYKRHAIDYDAGEIGDACCSSSDSSVFADTDMSATMFSSPWMSEDLLELGNSETSGCISVGLICEISCF